MSGLTALQKRLFKGAIRESVHKTYGYNLTGSLLGIGNTDKGLSYRYLVPPSLCRENSNLKHPAMSAGALMAVFDELSSWCLWTKDRKPRGGISVHLTTKIYKPIYANREIIMDTNIDKVGKIIGFCSMEVKDKQTQQILARGKHIKFMPIGMIFDILGLPYIMPYALRLFEIVLPKYRVVIDNIFETENWNLQDNLTDIENRLNTEIPGRNIVSSVYQEKLNIEQINNHQFKIHVIPGKMTNWIGIMHGGCVAMTIEECCMKSLHSILSSHHALHLLEHYSITISGMEVKYLSPMKGDLLIEVLFDNEANDLLSSHNAHSHHQHNSPLPVKKKTYGHVKNLKTNEICAEFLCHWKVHE